MNPLSGSVPLTLACHPRTPSRAIRGIDAVAGATPAGGLSLSFTLAGDLPAVRVPAPRSSRRAEGLWRHTCFEVFVMAGGGPGYREFNFSPSGEWAVYAFHGYRDGGPLETATAPGIAVSRRGDRLELAAEVPPACLPPGRSLRLGLAAVVEDAHGVLSYWALRHPAGPPDFHHTDAFALPLDLPGMPDVYTLTDEVRT